MKKIIRNNIARLLVPALMMPLAAIITHIWRAKGTGLTSGFTATVHTIWAVFGYLFALLLICAITAAINDIVTKRKNKKKQ